MLELLQSFLRAAFLVIATLNVYSLAIAQESQHFEDPLDHDQAVRAIQQAGSKGTGIPIKSGSVKLKLGSAILNDDLIELSGIENIIFNSDGSGFTVSLSGDHFFDFDKSDLLPAAIKSLEKISTLTQAYKVKSMLVEGHTDSLGSKMYNQLLSHERANSAKNWLVSNGFPESLITARGRGENFPLEPNYKDNGEDNPEGRARNRRIDLTVSTVKKSNDSSAH